MEYAKRFEQERHDRSREDVAVAARGEFLRAFPLRRLRNLRLRDYVIGQQSGSFCTFVEPRTKSWANIQGATAKKFGIYFGRTKRDATKKYRWSPQYGVNQLEAFRNIHRALLQLIEDGRERRYEALDGNPLSQMFKAKILSLYFPELYINVCSADHLETLARSAGVPEREHTSEYQHDLVQVKLANEWTRAWSNPKFMEYLYWRFMPEHRLKISATRISRPRRVGHRKIDIEDMLASRKKIGEESERFAVAWEMNRLRAVGHEELVPHIEDCRDRPSCGYDFRSFDGAEKPTEPRFIEVKTIGKTRDGTATHRFFLSETEHDRSQDPADCANYYFYLVQRDVHGPQTVFAIRAADLYKNSEKSPCAFVVRFELGKTNGQ